MLFRSGVDLRCIVDSLGILCGAFWALWECVWNALWIHMDYFRDLGSFGFYGFLYKNMGLWNSSSLPVEGAAVAEGLVVFGATFAASGFIIHQLDFPWPSFCTLLKRLCKDKLCRIEFCKIGNFLSSSFLLNKISLYF